MKKTTRLRWQRRFWIANIPVVVAVYFLAHDVYEATSVLYLVLLSLWTQIDNDEGALEAAKANEDE
jgi:hypothetical protein